MKMEKKEICKVLCKITAGKNLPSEDMGDYAKNLSRSEQLLLSWTELYRKCMDVDHTFILKGQKHLFGFDDERDYYQIDHCCNDDFYGARQYFDESVNYDYFEKMFGITYYMGVKREDVLWIDYDDSKFIVYYNRKMILEDSCPFDIMNILRKVLAERMSETRAYIEEMENQKFLEDNEVYEKMIHSKYYTQKYEEIKKKEKEDVEKLERKGNTT